MSHSAWAKAQRTSSARAKAVLKSLADYADVEGYVWAAVSVLVVETSLGSERTVQRGLSELRALKLLLETDRTHVWHGRILPVYRLALDRGPQNTRERLAQDRAAADRASTGDTGVTPSADGCHGCHPTGDTGDTPRVTRVTPKGEPEGKGKLGVSAQAHAPEAEGPFERVLRRWSQAAPERVSPVLDAEAWAIAAAKVGAEPLEAAALRYLAEAGEVKRARCKSLNAWLSERRYEAWIARGEAASVGDLLALAERFPSLEVRAYAVTWWCEGGLDGEAFARSYLDRARLDGRTITPRTDLARRKLLEHPALWKRLDLTIAPAAGAGREGGLVSAVGSGAGGR